MFVLTYRRKLVFWKLRLEVSYLSDAVNAWRPMIDDLRDRQRFNYRDYIFSTSANSCDRCALYGRALVYTDLLCTVRDTMNKRNAPSHPLTDRFLALDLVSWGHRKGSPEVLGALRGLTSQYQAGILDDPA